MNVNGPEAFLNRAATYPCIQEQARNRLFAASGYTQAAVLLPFVFHENRWQIILTKRSASLRSHTGQISFPGGKQDNGETPVSTALREACEEIGTPSDLWRTFPVLPPHYSTSGYEVFPVPALNEGSPALSTNPAEVAEIIYLPLDTALNRENYRTRTLQHLGRTVSLPALPFRHHDIWGLTAMILYGLAERYRYHLTHN